MLFQTSLMLSHLSRGKLLTKGNYERLVSHHNRELLEGTVGAVAKSAKENGVEKGIRKERERIIALLDKLRDSEYGEISTIDDLISLINEGRLHGK